LFPLQTQVGDAELDELILEATDGDPTASYIDYHAFVTKMMAV
jgi:hypothetical protein